VGNLTTGVVDFGPGARLELPVSVGRGDRITGSTSLGADPLRAGVLSPPASHPLSRKESLWDKLGKLEK